MVTILSGIVGLRNDKLEAFGPPSHQHTIAGMQEVEQRKEQLPSRLFLSPTGS